MVETAYNALIREVYFIQSVLFTEVPQLSKCSLQLVPSLALHLLVVPTSAAVFPEKIIIIASSCLKV